jgi:bifunctional non-homologous end joining protein LigD
VCAYSLRARAEPTVSAPVTWPELDAAVAGGDAGALTFTTADVLERVDRFGDLYADNLQHEQQLPAA